MDEQLLSRTRRSLHAVAELLIAGPQHREHGTIRLKVTPGGFGGAISPLRVAADELVTPAGSHPLRGSYGDLAAAAGVQPQALDEVYADTCGVGLDEQIEVDAAAAAVLARAFAAGEAAMHAFAPGEQPVLWPEHFDLGISLDEVDYGLSPGDAGHGLPYTYVGPWQRREGSFWNAPFGARLALDDAPDPAAIAAFFAAGRQAARTDRALTEDE
jgi:hypothetical protein